MPPRNNPISMMIDNNAQELILGLVLALIIATTSLVLTSIHGFSKAKTIEARHKDAMTSLENQLANTKAEAQLHRRESDVAKLELRTAEERLRAAERRASEATERASATIVIDEPKVEVPPPHKRHAGALNGIDFSSGRVEVPRIHMWTDQRMQRIRATYPHGTLVFTINGPVPWGDTRVWHVVPIGGGQGGWVSERLLAIKEHK